MREHALEKLCKKYIDNNRLFDHQEPVLIGLSGGTDSMVLAHVLLKLGYNLVAAHCNFHLRDLDSDADERLVRDWCAVQNIRCEVAHFDTVTYAKENGISIEMAARNLRYDWFETLRVAVEAQCIAVAHHLNDQVETFFINITRGTGISGLKGISNKNGHVVRPLLFALRSDIEKYATLHAIPYRYDKSNADTNIMRNYIRHEIMPRFEQLNPSFLDTMHRNMRWVGNVVRFLEQQFVQMEQELVTLDGKTVLIRFSENDEASVFQEFIHHYFAKNNWTVDAAQLALLMESQVGKRVVFDGYEVVRVRDGLRMRALNGSEPQPIVLESVPSQLSFGQFELDFTLLEHFNLSQIPLEGHSVWLDADKFQFPLTVRIWEPGDSMIPFGMNGQRKIKKMLTDARITGQLRTAYPVVCDAVRIAWLPGIRPDHSFAVTESTRRVLAIKFQVEK